MKIIRLGLALCAYVTFANAQEPTSHRISTTRGRAAGETSAPIAASSWEQMLSNRTGGKVEVIFEQLTNDKVAQAQSVRTLLDSIPDYYDWISEIHIGKRSEISVERDGRLKISIEPKNLASVLAEFRLPDGKIARFRAFMEEVRAMLPGKKVNFAAFGTTALGPFEGDSYAAFRKQTLAKIEAIKSNLNAFDGNYTFALYATPFRDATNTLFNENSVAGKPVERSLGLSLAGETADLTKNLDALNKKDSDARVAEARVSKALGAARVEFSRTLDPATTDRMAATLEEAADVARKSPQAAKTGFQVGFRVPSQTIFVHEGAPVFLVSDSTSAATLKSWIQTSDQAFAALR